MQECPHWLLAVFAHWHEHVAVLQRSPVGFPVAVSVTYGSSTYTLQPKDNASGGSTKCNTLSLAAMCYALQGSLAGQLTLDFTSTSAGITRKLCCYTCCACIGSAALPTISIFARLPLYSRVHKYPQRYEQREQYCSSCQTTWKCQVHKQPL